MFALALVLIMLSWSSSSEDCEDYLCGKTRWTSCGRNCKSHETRVKKTKCGGKGQKYYKTRRCERVSCCAGLGNERCQLGTQSGYGTHCCSASCAYCTGSGCGGLDGVCCGSDVGSDYARSCSYNPPPCIVDSAFNNQECRHGKRSGFGKHCCPAACDVCGGPGCSGDCCEGHINTDHAVSCSENMPPCIVDAQYYDPNEECQLGTQSDNGKKCCPASCPFCGGSGCGANDLNCCGSHIRNHHAVSCSDNPPPCLVDSAFRAEMESANPDFGFDANIRNQISDLQSSVVGEANNFNILYLGIVSLVIMNMICMMVYWAKNRNPNQKIKFTKIPTQN